MHLSPPPKKNKSIDIFIDFKRLKEVIKDKQITQYKEEILINSFSFLGGKEQKALTNSIIENIFPERDIYIPQLNKIIQEYFPARSITKNDFTALAQYERKLTHKSIVNLLDITCEKINQLNKIR
jgi:hypothetical protein